MNYYLALDKPLTVFLELPNTDMLEECRHQIS